MIEDRLDTDPELTPTDQGGQFDVLADGELVASRGGNVITRALFGAGYPDFDEVVDDLERRRA